MLRPIIVLAWTLTSFLISSMAVPAISLGAPSARRDPNVSYKSILEHHRAENLKRRGPSFSAFPNKSAMDAAVEFEKVDLSATPAWNDIEAVTKAFEYVRDKRFLSDREHPDFLRRLSWLYPDDGCFARAELASRELQTAGFAAPAKVFAFGDLAVQTSNSETGEISWWYHVVVGYRVGRKVVVFDPAIEATRPLTLQEWIDRMGGKEANIELSICSANAYEPDSNCLKSAQKDLEKALRDQRQFLPLEWSRVETLGHVPEKVLGEEPPWVKATQLIAL